ncbi:MAG: hypothetical protein FWG98_02490 [Candidatus Cloacimonetes bacterium]|nr:hypothetical protein [Candidatus Cloacimonadota bacterium]
MKYKKIRFIYSKYLIFIILSVTIFVSCTKQKYQQPFETFGNYLYYFETHLTERQKEMYNIVLAGLLSLVNEIEVPYGSIDEYSDILKFIRQDNPIIFYVSNFSLRTFGNEQKCVFIPQYTHNNKDISNSMNHIQNFLISFDEIKNYNDLDKLFYVYKYFVTNYTYDYSFHQYSYSILGLIYRQTAVCDGIARTMKLVLDYLNVKCIYVAGRIIDPAAELRTDGHAWNIIELDGKTYHIDTTWDLPKEGEVTEYFRNFNLTDSEIKQTRIIESRVPACVTYGKDFFTLNNMVVNRLSEFHTFVRNNLLNDNKRIVVKFNNLNYSQQIYDQIIEIAKHQYLETYNSIASASVLYYPEDMVFDITLETQGKDYNLLGIKIVNNMDEYRNHVSDNLKISNKFIVVRFRNIRYSPQINEQIREIARQEYLEIFNSIASVSILYYDEQMIFEITIETQGKDYNALGIKVVNNLDEYREHVQQILKSSNTNMVVRFRNMIYSEPLHEQIREIAMQAYMDNFNTGVSYSGNYFSEAMIFEINLSPR